MKTLLTLLLTGLGISSLAVQSLAETDNLFIYPAANQSIDQQERDEYECYLWARSETDFDPMGQARSDDDDRVRVEVAENPKENAAGLGVLLGAITGAVITDSSKGAIVGAGVGGIIGASSEASGQRQVEEEARASAAQLSAQMQQRNLLAANYQRAFSACLEGRGYVVR